jgi:hypothetical protein
MSPVHSRWACDTAYTASRAASNTPKKLSPSVPISVPPQRCQADRNTRRCTSNTSAYRLPNRYNNDVEPSMSGKQHRDGSRR